VFYNQENELSQVNSSSQQTVSDLSTQLSEQTSLGEMLLFTSCRLYKHCSDNLLLLLCHGGGPVYCDQFVCLSLCLSVSISLEPLDQSSLFCVQNPYDRGSVLLWRCRDTSCTSSFMDDVTFVRSGLYGDAWKAESLTYYH